MLIAALLTFTLAETVMPFPDTEKLIAEGLNLVSDKTGVEVAMVKEGGTCKIMWIHGFDDDIGIKGRSRQEPCQIFLRVGFMGLITPESFRCAIEHEFGHILLHEHGWHSKIQGSFMESPQSDNGKTCTITDDFLDQLKNNGLSEIAKGR